MINCGDCEKALNPFLDRELTDEDVVTVRGHLEACGGCMVLYQFEESLRRLVRVKCQEQGAPEAFRQRITLTLAMERTRLQNRKPRPTVYLAAVCAPSRWRTPTSTASRLLSEFLYSATSLL